MSYSLCCCDHACALRTIVHSLPKDRKHPRQRLRLTWLHISLTCSLLKFDFILLGDMHRTRLHGGDLWRQLSSSLGFTRDGDYDDDDDVLYSKGNSF